MSAPTITAIAKRIDQTMLDRYAEASGDYNPIHIDEAFARTTPLGGTIAHGMLVLAFISEMMTAALGRAWLEGGSLDVRFRAPARPGDTITARAEPAAGEGSELRYSVECVNQNEEVLISGTARVTPDE